MLTEAPILTLPKSGENFAIFNDASLNGLGCVLMQYGICNDSSLLVELRIKPVLLDQIKEAQSTDAKLVEKLKLAQEGDNKNFKINPEMKRAIVEYVAKCLICQRVKVEHQVLTRLLQPISIPE
ncbi:DNA/RNA polymerases superfamily protein [Gossypium australe]|uniref:DNA/RNA polymerases superfamily protein n=1 Tax=Gossypium australe TaxID=47621 RepID=A0A5B6VPQ2_9ROSI|nr:DNA/RNA polymerases superfamily protein [Gossypium australe]